MKWSSGFLNMSAGDMRYAVLNQPQTQSATARLLMGSAGIAGMIAPLNAAPFVGQTLAFRIAGPVNNATTHLDFDFDDQGTGLASIRYTGIFPAPVLQLEVFDNVNVAGLYLDPATNMNLYADKIGAQFILSLGNNNWNFTDMGGFIDVDSGFAGPVGLQGQGNGGQVQIGESTVWGPGQASLRMNGLVDGQAAGIGTLTNAPAAGNPRAFMPIDFGGAIGVGLVPVW